MRFPRKRYSHLRVILFGALIVLIGFAGYRAIGFLTEAGDFDTSPPAVSAEAEKKQPVPAPEPEADPVIVISETVQSGDTVGKLLEPYLSPADIQALADSCSRSFELRRIRQGNPYRLTINNGEFESLVYEIDSEKKLIIERKGGNFLSKLENIVYEVEMKRISGEIKNHLFQAVGDAGEEASLAVNMADIFAWEINFIRDLRPGDTFTLMVEKRYRKGEFKGYGSIKGAHFVNQGTLYEAYLFRDAAGFPHYYTHKGESTKRAFLKAPLSFTRISSTFTNSRLHPVLKVWRAHPGVDYAAPIGTPVKAIGSGTVTFKGWGTGAGNYIALNHNNGYESMYLHLSNFAKGLQQGKRVQQGEVIGFVGSTGYSTGPHLDFRMKKGGQYINPLKTASPRTEPVLKKDFPEFQSIVNAMRRQLGVSEQ